MAKKRYVNTIFWDDAYIANLDPSEKLVFIYLITNPCTNISGVYQIPLKRISLDTGIEKEMIAKIISRFQKDNKVLYLDGWIAIKNFIKHQNYNSPNIKIGIEKEFEESPNELLNFINIPYPYGIDTLSNKHINIDLNLNQDLNLNKNNIPSISEIADYCTEKGYTDIDPEYFWNYYQARGWKYKTGQPMKDWKAAVQTWRKNNKKTNKTQTIDPAERLRQLEEEDRV